MAHVNSIAFRTAVASFVVAFVLVQLSVLTGCRDKVIDPPATHSAYTVFFYNWGMAGKPGEYKAYYRYQMETQKLDSFWLNTYPIKMFASADGRRLFVKPPITSMIQVVDADNLTRIGELPVTGELSASPDNRYLAICTGPGLTVLDASSYAIVFQDTGQLGSGVFSKDSRRFYARGVAQNSTGRSNYLYSLSVRGWDATRKQIRDLGGFIMRINSEASLMFYMYSVSTFVDLFRVYDILKDSILFEEPLIPGNGDLIVNPRGEHVYVSNTGTILVGPPPPYTFVDYDVSGRRLDTLILRNSCDTLPAMMTLPEEFAVSSDGKWLAGASTWSLSLSGLLMYDLDAKEGHYLCLPIWFSRPVITKCQVQ